MCVVDQSGIHSRFSPPLACRISQRGLQQEMGGGGGAAAAALAALGHNGIAAGPQQPIFGTQFAPQVSIHFCVAGVHWYNSYQRVLTLT
jgi:hypothetical protein